MKIIKWVAVLFCFAVALPAMAQKVQAEMKETADLKEEKCLLCGLTTEEKITANLSDVVIGKKALAAVEGELQNFSYFVEAAGDDMSAYVESKHKDYRLVMEKFKDSATGEMVTARYCEGDEKICKAIANGRECDMNAAPPQEICFVKGREKVAKTGETIKIAAEEKAGDVIKIHAPAEEVAKEEWAKAEEKEAKLEAELDDAEEELEWGYDDVAEEKAYEEEVEEVKVSELKKK